MRVTRVLIGALTVAILAAACAGPNQLTKQSQDELRRGNAEKAYELAKRAVDKAPGNEAAHQMLVAAGARLLQERKDRVRALAARGDTLTSARASLELAGLFAELARYEAAPPPDLAYNEDVRRIRHGAADYRFREGQARLADKHPKDAYSSFVDAADYEPGYPGLQEMIQKTYQVAMMRLAIVPFENQTEIPELSRRIEDQVVGAVWGKVKAPEFRFTTLVAPDQIYPKMTLPQINGLSREDAITLGRQIGARRIVRGRIYGLRTDSRSERYHTTLHRRILEKGLRGRTVVRWEDCPFDATWRQREITLRWEIQVIDTDSEEILEQRGDQIVVSAYSSYSSFQPQGDCKEYYLLAPGAEEADPDGVKSSRESWAGVFGHLSVPDALERCRKYRDRTSYKPDYRKDFLSASREYPAFCDDLPGSDEMALIALDPLWKPVFETIRGQDLR